MSGDLDPRVHKVLGGLCWAKDCKRQSEVPVYFRKSWEPLEKPILCIVHNDYRHSETHYGSWDAVVQKWSCCDKNYRESKCGEIETLIYPVKDRITISEEQENSFDKRLRELEERVESNFCSENWDRS